MFEVATEGIWFGDSDRSCLQVVGVLVREELKSSVDFWECLISQSERIVPPVETLAMDDGEAKQVELVGAEDVGHAEAVIAGPLRCRDGIGRKVVKSSTSLANLE